MSGRVPPQMGETPAERHLRAVRAGHMRAAKAPSAESISAPARSAFLSSFTRKAMELNPGASAEEVARIAAHLRKAHFAALGRASAAARRTAQKPAS